VAGLAAWILSKRMLRWPAGLPWPAAAGGLSAGLAWDLYGLLPPPPGVPEAQQLSQNRSGNGSGRRSLEPPATAVLRAREQDLPAVVAAQHHPDHKEIDLRLDCRISRKAVSNSLDSGAFSTWASHRPPLPISRPGPGLPMRWAHPPHGIGRPRMTSIQRLREGQHICASWFAPVWSPCTTA